MQPHAASIIRHSQRATSILAAVTAALLAGACSNSSGVTPLDGLLGSSQPTADAATEAKPVARTELEKAIEYWGEQHKKNPRDLKAALAYSRNLKASGNKEQAFAVLQDVAILHGDNKELASEMGRLALEFGNVGAADQLLAAADDPAKPEWRTISARGTVMAKQNKFAEAIPFYERALKLQPGQPTVMNNLAMAHAANGDPVKAETILRQAGATSNDPKIKQNLALVLGLQGKHDEAKAVRASSVPASTAEADDDYIKRMVKATPAAAPAPATAAVAAQPATPAPSPRAQQARVTEAKGKAKAKDEALRPASGPSDVGGTPGAWSTTVQKAR